MAGEFGIAATDKMIFTFSDFPGSHPSCGIHACSESQVFSLKDFSTNYCNLRNLYCSLVGRLCTPPGSFGGGDRHVPLV